MSSFFDILAITLGFIFFCGRPPCVESRRSLMSSPSPPSDAGPMSRRSWTLLNERSMLFNVWSNFLV